MKKRFLFIVSGLLVAALILAGRSQLAVNAQETPYAWLEGSWEGEGFGGMNEEVWSAPSKDGTMMGTYRHLNKEGEVEFYELMILDATGIRLKHFNPDLTGWESKEDHVAFKMIAANNRMIEMEGLVYEKKNENEVDIRLEMGTKEGQRTEVFQMKRVR